MSYTQVTSIERRIEKVTKDRAQIDNELATLNAALKEVQSLINKMKSEGLSTTAIRAELSSRFKGVRSAYRNSTQAERDSECDVVLAAFPTSGNITTNALVELTGFTAERTRQALKRLLESNKVVQSGAKRSTKYSRA